jgi:hypothetical protein
MHHKERNIRIGRPRSERKVEIRRARRRGKRRENNKADGRRVTIVGTSRLYVFVPKSEKGPTAFQLKLASSHRR